MRAVSSVTIVGHRRCRSDPFQPQHRLAFASKTRTDGETKPDRCKALGSRFSGAFLWRLFAICNLRERRGLAFRNRTEGSIPLLIQDALRRRNELAAYARREIYRELGQVFAK